MTFEEFKGKYGKYNAYHGWITVAGAKLVGKIPEKFSPYFDDLCECGSENIISPALTQETCCNPKCKVKVAYQLAEMFSRCGVKGLGYATCRSIYNSLCEKDKKLKKQGEHGLFTYNVYTEVLLIPWELYPMDVKTTAKGVEFFAACNLIRSKSFTFPQMVSVLGLADLGSNSDRIFGGYDSFDAWCDAVQESGGITNFCVHQGVHSCDVIFSVAVAMETIAVADFALKDSMRTVGMYNMSVCMTGSASVDGIKYTKAAFVDACNDLCVDNNGIRLLELKNTSGPATVPFVLYSAPTATSKFVTGKNRGIIDDEFGEHPVLMSTSDFYNWLKGAMTEWNQQLTQQLNSKMNFCQTLKKELQKQLSLLK